MGPVNNNGLQLVKDAPRNDSSVIFRVGETIQETGIYRVFHCRHRVSHEVTLLSGERFPRCSVCGDKVHFELLRCVAEMISDGLLWGVHLYEIPHPSASDINQVEQVGA